MNKRTEIGLLAIMPILLIFFYFWYGGKKLTEVNRDFAAKVNAENKEFASKVDAARRETSNLCGKQLMRMIPSPPHSPRNQPTIIVAGEDVTPLLYSADGVSFEPRQMPDGSLSIRILIQSATPKQREIIWRPLHSPACTSGQAKQINTKTIPAINKRVPARAPTFTAK